MSQTFTAPAAIGKIRSPWGVWWLTLLTAGIYYLVWYVKLNKEIARASGPDVRVEPFGLWFSQCIPIAAWMSLANTASRLNTAQHRRGTAPTTSGGMAILSTLWFWSQTRYLQRRANALWRYMEYQQVALTGPTDPLGAIPAAALPEPLGHSSTHVAAIEPPVEEFDSKGD